jgi:hypothetical protein
MPQSFCPFNTEEERTLLARGEETTTPQAARASNSHVLGLHLHQENTQFSTDQKGAKNTSLVDLLLSKGVVDSHFLHKVFHSFPKVVPSERTSIATRVAIINNTKSTI